MDKRLDLSDLYASTYVEMHGIEPELKVVRNKTLFSFPATDSLYKLLSEYNSGGECSAIDFTEHMKTLRSRMMDVKRGGSR